MYLYHRACRTFVFDAFKHWEKIRAAEKEGDVKACVNDLLTCIHRFDDDLGCVDALRVHVEGFAAAVKDLATAVIEENAKEVLFQRKKS